jgi:predicted deacylase
VATDVRVETLGDGDPSVAVVGGIHGDEPCGPAAVERLLAAPPDLRAPVKLVVANEEALERGVRFVDADLNRSFPGDAGSDAHEERLAAALADELADCVTLALHSTRSGPEPFAVVAGVGDVERRVVTRFGVDAVVDTEGGADGRIFAAGRAVEVECGLQGSDDAADAAEALSRRFLAATGAADLLADAPPARSVPLYELGAAIEKPAGDPRTFARNFEEVAAGERFAAAGGVDLVAEAAFVPVLLSPDGYEDIFGYRARRVGTVDPLDGD